MSSVQDQAAATQQSGTMTDEEKARVLELQRQINETVNAASAPNPGGSDEYLRQIPKESPAYRAYQSWLETTKQASEKLPELQSQYDQLVSSKPELKQFAESHPATQYEVHEAGLSLFGASAFQTVTQNHRVLPTTDAQKYAKLKSFAEQNPNASIGEVVKFYEASPLPQGNATIDYQSTLAARQAGFNVGSGIAVGLADTFEKDQTKRFAEHNKGIALTEGANPLVSKPTPPEPKVTPQNPRPQIERNNPNHLFANPEFAQKGSDRYRGIKPQVQVLPDNLFTSRAEYSSGPFDLSGTNNTASIFGIEPEKPKQLSDLEFSKLSPNEQQAYLDRIAQWNQYAEYASNKSNELNKGLKLVNQANWQKYKGDLLSYLKAEKEAGTKQVTILTHNKITTVPIEQAFLGIVSKAYSTNPDDRITGILTPPTIPAGYHVAGVNLTGEGFTEFGSNPVGTLLVAQNETPKPASSETPSGADWWSGFVGKIGERANQITSDRSQNVAARTLAAGGQVGAEILGGLISIGGEVSKFKLPDIRKAAGELFNGTGTNQTGTNSTEPIIPPGTITDRNLNVTNPEPPADVTPPTAPGALVSGLSTSVMAAAVTRNPSLLLSGASDAFKQYSTIAARQGLLPTVVQTALYVDPLAVIKIVPIRATRLVIPVGRGIGKAITSDIISETAARQLKIGYSENLGRAGVGYANGKFFLGIPKPTNISLEKLAYTPERGGYRITEGPSGTYMTSQQVLDRLVKIGKINPEEAQLITVQREAAKLTGKIKDVPQRTDLTSIEGGQPQASLLPGKETATLEDLLISGQKSIRNPTPAVKGSIINQYFDLSPRQRRDLDVDLGMTGKPIEKQAILGARESKRITTGMNALESLGRTFVDKSGSVEVLTGGKSQKVIEFVTEKDSLNYGKNYKSNPDIVFGEKVPHKVISPGGRGKLKMLTYRFQGLRKTSSILELGGDLPKQVGDNLGVSKGREKDIRDNVEYLLTKASQAKNERTAIKLKEAAIITERFARKRGLWTETGIEENPLSDVQPPNILRSIGTGSQKVSRQITPTGKASLLSQQNQKTENRFASRSTGSKFERSVGSKFEMRSAGMRSVGTKSPSLAKSVGMRSVGSKSTGLERSTGSKSQGSPSRSKSTGGLVSPGKSPSLTSLSHPSPGKPSPSNPLTGKPSPGSPSPGSPGFRTPPIKTPPVKIPPWTEPPRTTPPEGLLPKKNALAIKRREKNERTKPDFLGNVPEEQVSGMFNRYETIVGTKRSARQLRKDNALIRKKNNVKSFVHGSNKQFLSNKPSPILERPKEKKLKKGQIRKWGKNPF